MTNTESVNPASSTVNDLRRTLDAWSKAHADHQRADEVWREVDYDLKACKQQAAFLASNDTTLKNAEQRAAFITNHLREMVRELLDGEADAATDRRNAGAELERLTEQLKTLRVICNAEISERDAQTALAQAEAFRLLPF